MRSYLDLEATIGGYEAAESEEGQRLLQRPYDALASLLSCDPADVAVVNSATAAWQRVFLGLPLWLPGSTIITSLAEYGSNYIAYMQARARFGCAIRVIEETADCDLDLEHLEELLKEAAARPGMTLVSLTHVPTSSGRVYCAEAVGELIAHCPDVVYLLDACQTVGQMPVHVGQLRCHFLTGTGRKYLRAPRGSGFLYASPHLPDLPCPIEPAAMDVRSATWRASPSEDGHSDGSYEPSAGARRYEEYEMSFAAKVGLGVASQIAHERGPEWIFEHIMKHADELRSGLGKLDRVTVQDRGARLCGIVSFTVDGIEPASVKKQLSAMRKVYDGGVNVSASFAPSTRGDFERRGLASVVRASPHYYNTEADVSYFLSCVEDIVQ